MAWAKAYLHVKCHLDPSSRLATINMGRKLWAVPCFWGAGAGSPSNAMPLGPRPTSLPKWHLDPCSHLATTDRPMGRKLECPFRGGELCPHLTLATRAEAYLHTKFHVDPSNRLATIHQRYRHDRQTGQWSDSIGRTVLQTVAQKVPANFDKLRDLVCVHSKPVYAGEH